ncbi:MAG: hypothetical protein ACF8CY_07010, partial [Gimesia chilikensis]
MSGLLHICKPLIVCLTLCCSCLWLGGGTQLAAQGTQVRSGSTITEPRDYRSKNFLIHTDLSPDEAQDLLARLEKMLVIISAYWA